MKEQKNNVSICGVLVKNNLEEFKTKKGDDAIGGTLVLRTSDNSEHEVRFYANKYKKDENKNFTSEEGYFYKEYLDAKDTLIDLEHATELSPASVVSITDGQFTVNDFKGRDGKLAMANQISARFINKIESKDYETTVMEAKFEVEGIIESIKDEIKDNVPTGNLIVTLDAIRQTADGFGKDAVYEVDSLVPIKMFVDKEMATAFRSAGYYEGCFTKFFGKVINYKEKTTITEPQSFGPDIVKEITIPVKRNEIKSGSTPSSIFEHELDQNIVDSLKSKRKLHLNAVMSGAVNSEVPFAEKPDTSKAPQMSSNPFASGSNSMNPFLQ